MMPFMQDPGDLPPEIQEQMRRAEEFRAKVLAMEIEQRRMLLRFSAVMCTCLRPDGRFFGTRTTDSTSMPSYQCAVHGSYMITPDGTMIG